MKRPMLATLAPAVISAAMALVFSTTAWAIGPGRVELRGKIEAIDPGGISTSPSLVVMGQVVTQMGPPPTIHDVPPGLSVITFADLRVNDLVHVHGIAMPAPGFIAAVEIFRESAFEPQDFELRGAIDPPLAAESFTVAGMTIAVDPATVILGARGQPADFTNLAAGKIVLVKGGTRPDGTLLAATVKIQDASDRQNVEIRASLRGLGRHGLNRYWTAPMGRRVEVPLNARVIGKRRVRLSFAELQFGDRVQVEAVRLAGGVLRAKSLAVNRSPARGRRVTGRITSRGDHSFVAGGKNFQILPPAANIQGPFGEDLGSRRLRVGDVVRVDFLKIDGTPVARNIVLLP